MAEEQPPKTEKMQPETVKFLSLGGEEDVTRNMYLYEYKDQILIVVVLQKLAEEHDGQGGSLACWA